MWLYCKGVICRRLTWVLKKTAGSDASPYQQHHIQTKLPVPTGQYQSD